MTARLVMAALLASLSINAPASAQAGRAAALALHYDKPASTWTEALPIGNGRLGAMVFGKVDEELIQLNEATLWSGGPVEPNVNPTAFDHLAKSREALAAGDYAAAYNVVKNMQGRYTESFLPLGDLVIRQDTGTGATSNYYRGLNIRDGIASTTFSANGVQYKREIFASAPGQVIVVRMTADKARQLSFEIEAKSQIRFATAAANSELVMTGKAPARVEPSYLGNHPNPIVYDDPAHCKGMRFELIVKPIIKDGTLSTENNKLKVEGASEVVLLLSAATSFAGFDQCPDSAGKDQHALARAPVEQASKQSYASLLKAHVADFRRFFDRMSLTLNPGAPDKSAITTDQRLADYTAGQPDAALEALYVQYGRYLLISSSRTKDAPANLQGIWNHHLRAPWSSNYTTNINVQMNYWPVEVANLSELFSPLNDLIRNLAVTGKETAASFYHAPGWVLHHNADIWAASNPVGAFGDGDPKWANWYMGSAWISRHLWEHYQFTGDKQYLKQAYPVMKGAADFMLAWLQKDPNGRLVTMPSTSPENAFYYGDKLEGTVSVASTMDMGIIRDLFNNVVAASEVMGTDQAFRATLIAAKKQLFPFQVGSRGQLQEWYKDFDEVEPNHRHTSHLYALHPAQDISPLNTPELAAAAKKTLELRGDDGTGWSLAWKVNMWARLLDGNHAHTLFKHLLRLTKEGDRHGGAYANLFDAHPPFQIDGNFAGTAGVIEMLLQSQNHEIHLLPALPAVWQSGAVTGLLARGNFVVDIGWANNRLASARIVARQGGKCVIRTALPVTVAGVKARSEKSAIGYRLAFDAVKGRAYQVRPAG